MKSSVRSLSLATKITIMVVAIILLATIPIGIFAFRVYQSDSIEMHQSRAVIAAQGVASLIDPEQFMLAMETGEKNEYYMELQRQLNRAKAEMGLLFLFAGVANDRGDFTAFAEGLLPQDTRTVDLGDVIPVEAGVFPPELLMAQRGTAIATPIIPSGVDENYVVAAYAPVFNANGVPIGIVGVNVMATEVFAKSNAFAMTIFGIVAAVIIVVVWIPIFWVRKYVGKPLKKLCEVSDNIADGNMNTKIPNMKSTDEIGQLAESFRCMASEISTVIDESQKRSRAITSGNLRADRSNYLAKGDFQTIIDSIDNVASNVFQYLDDLSCAIVIFDSEYRFTFINGLARSQGYDPNVLVGQSILDVMPPAEADSFRANFGRVNDTGKMISYQIDMITPGGEPFHADQAIIPIKDNSGKLTAYLLFGYVTTEMVQAKRRSEKIAIYQKTETDAIAREFRAGLDQGIMKFNFKPEQHDSDTAEVAEAFGKIGKMIELFGIECGAAVNEISQHLQSFANGNFDITVAEYYRGDFAAIKDSIDGLVVSIGNLVSEIKTVTSQVETGAEQISHSTQSLMASFEEQATAMSEVREAVSTLTEKTQKNATDAQNANELSKQVQSVANTGSRHMRDMSEVMEEIKSASAEIAKVASIIDGIAFQTNLLALNASVEAARAGDHGKGFAVVAEEVRNLAGRSSEAAKNTSDMIAQSLSRVNEGVAKSVETAEALEKIVEVTASVTSVISSIATASNEQAEEISRIQNSMESIHRGANDNASSVQNNAAVSEKLSSQANMLMSLVDRFKTKKEETK
ncbi:MAG: methyl-accepting chemotaxis protein [Defluviitaleaceae bacterium]|nr:methyl-accepting chemotaxis protein [Defluviitaleaceae bacterium]